MKNLLLLTLLTPASLWAFEETEGMRVMRLGCDKQKEARGCFNYANFLRDQKEEEKADAYFDKACKAGDERGCRKESWSQKTEAPASPSEITVVAPVVPAKELTPLERLKESLKDCKELTQSFMHPMIQSFTVVEKIIGLRDGLCEYQQTMPNKGLLTCKLKEDQRKNFESIEKLMDDSETCQVSSI